MNLIIKEKQFLWPIGCAIHIWLLFGIFLLNQSLGLAVLPAPLNAPPDCPFEKLALSSDNTSPQPARDVAELIAQLTKKYPLGQNHADSVLFRGITDPDYGEKELIGYLKGERKHELRSWNYTRIWQKLIQAGMSEVDATAQADLEIVREIQNDINALEVRYPKRDTILEKYFVEQVKGTFAGKPKDQKQSPMIPFYQGQAPIAINYYLMGDMRKQPKGASPLGILFKGKESVRRGFGFDGEYHVASHFPVSDLKGAYLAFPTKNVQDRDFSVLHTAWYYVGVVSRNPDGSAKEITVNVAKWTEGTAEPKIETELFQYTFGDKTQENHLRSVALKHPHLEKLINSLLK